MGTCLSYLSHCEKIEKVELKQVLTPPRYAERDPLLSVPADHRSAPLIDPSNSRTTAPPPFK